MLFTQTLQIKAQVATYETTGLNRLLTVTGLAVNGAIYDVHITYTTTVSEVLETGLPDVLTNDAALQALETYLNNHTSPTGPADYDIVHLQEFRAISDNTLGFLAYIGGIGKFFIITKLTGISTAPLGVQINRGYAIYTKKPKPIPTMSQWGLLIFGLLIMNLGLFFLKRKELI